MSALPASSILSSAWSLQGRTIVVTGGSKGIGKAVVHAVLERGASTVVFCSRSDASTLHNELQTEFPKQTIVHVLCDVSTADGRQVLVDAIQKLPSKQIHGLVNNVGINVRKDIHTQTAEEYDQIIRTNVDSAYFLCRQLHPFLTHNNGLSAVVNVSSAAGVQSSGTGIAYAMSKAALNQLTKTLACEWAKYGIRVNAVTPWMTMTPLLEKAVENNPTQLDKVKAWTPMHRLADATEVALPVVFLLMGCSSYITGQLLGIDGGLTAQGFDGPCVTREE